MGIVPQVFVLSRFLLAGTDGNRVSNLSYPKPIQVGSSRKFRKATSLGFPQIRHGILLHKPAYKKLSSFLLASADRFKVRSS